MENFCGSKLWNWNLTWYTDDPDFTSCFEKTALTWTPCFFLWIGVALDICCSSSKVQPIPWTFLSRTKTGISVLLIFLEIARYVYKCSLPDEVVFYPIDTWNPILRVLTLIVYLHWVFHSRLTEIQSTGVQFFYWLMHSVCETILLRSAAKAAGGNNNPDNILLIFEVLNWILIFCQFIASCWSDVGPSLRKDYNYLDRPSPEGTASFLNKIFFAWLDTLIWQGWRKPLDPEDLFELSHEDKSEAVVAKFDKYWNWEDEEIDGNLNDKSNSGYNKRKHQNVIPVLLRVFGLKIFCGSFYRNMQDGLSFVSPVLLSMLISFVKNENEETWKGYLYAISLFSIAICQTLCLAQNNKIMYRSGLQIRAALISAIYRKSLLISTATNRKGSTVGEIVNLMGIDVQKVADFIPSCNFLWCAPIQLSIVVWLLWNLLGHAVWAGILVMVTFTLINFLLTSTLKRNQSLVMKSKDERIQLMNQILVGIKVLKLYGWETFFSEQICKIREREMKVVKRNLNINSLSTFFWICTPFSMSLATFATFVMADQGNILDAQKAFVSLTLFNIMRVPLVSLPDAIGSGLQAYISSNRITKFMNSPEIDTNSVTHYPKENDAITIEKGYFSWGSHQYVPTLKNINVNIKRGSLVAVVGVIGSGKSTLLSAMLGEIEKLSGLVNTTGSISYVPQQAWIQNGTVRENILFGKPYSRPSYSKVLRDCALLQDLQILPGGDSTEIGEKGINLSGGQRQRISLARAVFHGAEIYLLDDPLSAVDSHVGKHIFENVIGPNGSMKGKTRVLVTHGISFLPQVDQIIVLKNGQVSEVGTYEFLMEKMGDFGEFLIQHTPDAPGEDETPLHGPESHIPIATSDNQSSATARRFSVGEKIIQVETYEKNNVKSSVYFEYCRAAGWPITLCTLFIFSVYQAFVVASNFWLSSWTSGVENVTFSSHGIPKAPRHSSSRDQNYLYVYGAFGIGQAISIVLACYVLSLGTLKSSRFLHLRMLKRVLRAPLWFFETTPVGRLINRFAKDVDVIDLMLPAYIRRLVIFSFQAIGVLVIICYTIPLFILVLVPIAALYCVTQRIYVSTSRQLKRLESVTRSPIYSHFGETVSGASSIRAYKSQHRFILDSEEKTDENLKCCFPALMSTRWVELRLEIVGTTIVFFTALFVVVGRESLDAGLAGLAISSALLVVKSLSSVVYWTSEVEANIVSVERLKEYGEGPEEAPWQIEDKKPPKSWPENGGVQFHKYHASYRTGKKSVLKNVCCTVQPKEKIGIVGRTGAGKSSLALALFRIIEPTHGTIKIDGIDITGIGLHDLRQRITIIPQDPTLFSGNLRENLDPFSQHSDEKIWHASELAHLKDFIFKLPGRLNHEVSEGGENFSVGQRQLVCLARALLRDTKLLILDEATAAVDLETDDLIQETIRSEFSQSTVLTIAHRLNTVMDSTRVMVLNNGEICEFDTPENLLANKSSAFHSLAKEAGLV